MSIYNCTIIIQHVREQVWAVSEKLTRFLLEQQALPVFVMPDLPADQAAIRVELKRHDVYLFFTVECASKKEADLMVQQLSERIETEAFSRKAEAHIGVAGFVTPELVTMNLDLVLQGLNPQALYAVYRTGAVYEIHGEERIHELEDPHSPLFQVEFAQGGLRKLSALEARQVLNSRSFTYVWTRRGGGRKHFSQNNDNWFARHA
jgi:hypothetical protein